MNSRSARFAIRNQRIVRKLLDIHASHGERLWRLIIVNDWFDGEAVYFCPVCGSTEDMNVEEMEGGTVDFYCERCGRSGEISVDEAY
jgi:hypothetical protein